jgi:hypothetical protein
VLTSGWVPAFQVDAGANTGMTANTEFPLTKVSSVIRTWADGTVPNQRNNWDDAITLNGTTTLATFTDAYGRFTAKSIAGAKGAITRNWGLGTDGNLQVQGSAYFGAATTAPTAFITIAAGTTTAGTAPLKFTLGSDQTTGEIGAFNFSTISSINRLAFVPTGTTYKRVPFTNDVAPSNGQIPIGNGTDYTVANITSTGGSITVTNGSGTIDISTTKTLTDGTYTPTLTNVTNIAGSTAYVTGYYRIGNSVTVFGKVDINPTLSAATASEIAISLPVASDLAQEEDLGGVAVSDSLASETARIKGDATNNRASIVFKSISVSNDSYSFEFSYQVK